MNREQEKIANKFAGNVRGLMTDLVRVEIKEAEDFEGFVLVISSRIEGVERVGLKKIYWRQLWRGFDDTAFAVARETAFAIGEALILR